MRLQLISNRKLAVMLSAALVGSAMGPIREYLDEGKVSGVSLGASAAAFVFGLAIILAVRWYANRPEN